MCGLRVDRFRNVFNDRPNKNDFFCVCLSFGSLIGEVLSQVPEVQSDKGLYNLMLFHITSPSLKITE